MLTDAQCAQTCKKAILSPSLIFLKAFLYYSVDFFRMKAEKIEEIRSAVSILRSFEVDKVVLKKITLL